MSPIIRWRAGVLIAKSVADRVAILVGFASIIPEICPKKFGNFYENWVTAATFPLQWGNHQKIEGGQKSPQGDQKCSL